MDNGAAGWTVAKVGDCFSIFWLVTGGGSSSSGGAEDLDGMGASAGEGLLLLEVDSVGIATWIFLLFRLLAFFRWHFVKFLTETPGRETVFKLKEDPQSSAALREGSAALFSDLFAAK
jgi:hypothetical protein